MKTRKKDLQIASDTKLGFSSTPIELVALNRRLPWSVAALRKLVGGGA
jgi:hypothetical protein